MDVTSVFHQIRVAKSSQPTLAFVDMEATKYTWHVMPFGPVNSPVIHIIFVHDMNGTWKKVASSRRIDMTLKDVGTCLIVDDINSLVPTSEIALKYLRCQLEVCWAQTFLYH